MMENKISLVKVALKNICRCRNRVHLRFLIDVSSKIFVFFVSCQFISPVEQGCLCYFFALINLKKSSTKI